MRFHIYLAERRKNEKSEFRAQISQLMARYLHLIQETESENNLVRFLLCIDFQHLRTLRHCTLASPATAQPGAKRPQKAKKPKHA